MALGHGVFLCVFNGTYQGSDPDPLIRNMLPNEALHPLTRITSEIE